MNDPEPKPFKMSELLDHVDRFAAQHPQYGITLDSPIRVDLAVFLAIFGTELLEKKR